MRERHKQAPQSAEETVRDIRRATRRHFSAEEKIRIVETSHLPVRRALDKIGIPKTTFYAWLDRYMAGGFDALEDRKPPSKVRDRPDPHATLAKRHAVGLVTAEADDRQRSRSVFAPPSSIDVDPHRRAQKVYAGPGIQAPRTLTTREADLIRTT
jgi:transposase-like protein